MSAPEQIQNPKSKIQNGVTAPELVRMKARGERIVMVTAYDYPSARLADAAGVDALLVGDSLGMVVLGHGSTLPLTMEAMLHHVEAVVRAKTRAMVIADLPFLSYQVNEDEAVRNAGRMLQAGAAAVKVEGGGRIVPLVERLTATGIPVMGHLGMTPQSVRGFGGFRVQAKEPEAARRLLQDARALEGAGAFGMVLEAVPVEVSAVVTREVRIPTIGIGAGPECDGEVQVFHDILGLWEEFKPRHTRRYALLGEAIRNALTEYAADVRQGRFPAEENTFHVPELEDPEAWKS